MRNLIKQFLSIQMRIKVRNFFDLWGTRSYSQEGEDLILSRIFEGKNNGFYVDIGAHHPMRFSNTYALYKRGWKGINVEPNPDSLKLFTKLRPKDLNLNFGIASQTGVLKYFMFNEPALNTFEEGIVKGRLENGQYQLLREVDIKVYSLGEILNQYKSTFDNIDLLTIDVEGLDLDVLKSNDWDRYKPNWVLVEQLGLKNLESLEFETHMFLSSKGYVLFAKTFNTLFYKYKLIA